MTGYSRDQFGQAWADVDRNGCDTRNDVLRRDLVDVVLKAGTHGCVVLAGDLAPEPYSGQQQHFVRGVGTSTQVQIDHVVALGDAWQKGAQQWPAAERLAFANDPLELLAVNGPLNQSKGDGDTATWLPPNKTYRCAYVARQVSVKAKYRLWVTAAERDAMARILTACPAQPLLTSSQPTVASIAGSAVSPPKATATGATTRSAAPVRTSTPMRSSAPAPTKTTSVLDPRFSTCKAAKAAGYGPYYEGKDPEYAWYRDADHDGVDCE
ncbi:MAG: GmrSD restriction endonuclease domain-containing protein [Motilibacteraceae bacterium]